MFEYGSGFFNNIFLSSIESFVLIQAIKMIGSKNLFGFILL
jgi:hypothetical protein